MCNHRNRYLASFSRRRRRGLLAILLIIALGLGVACGGEEPTPAPTPAPTPVPTPTPTPLELEEQVFQQWVSQNSSIISGLKPELLGRFEQVSGVFQAIARGEIGSFEESGLDPSGVSAELATAIEDISGTTERLRDLKPPSELASERQEKLTEAIGLAAEGLNKFVEAMGLVKQVLGAGRFDLFSLAPLSSVPQLSTEGQALVVQANDILNSVAREYE
ncbi:MAG: hypothetical protein V3U79_09305 [Dehalococcoidia bacterium]